MELQNILYGFFERYGSAFTFPPSKKQYFGRISPVSRSNTADIEATRLGSGLSAEYELITSTFIPELAKGVELCFENRLFVVCSVGDFTLNGKPIYFRALLKELGGAL